MENTPKVPNHLRLSLDDLLNGKIPQELPEQSEKPTDSVAEENISDEWNPVPVNKISPEQVKETVSEPTEIIPEDELAFERLRLNQLTVKEMEEHRRRRKQFEELIRPLAVQDTRLPERGGPSSALVSIRREYSEKFRAMQEKNRQAGGDEAVVEAVENDRKKEVEAIRQALTPLEQRIVSGAEKIFDKNTESGFADALLAGKKEAFADPRRGLPTYEGFRVTPGSIVLPKAAVLPRVEDAGVEAVFPQKDVQIQPEPKKKSFFGKLFAENEEKQTQPVISSVAESNPTTSIEETEQKETLIPENVVSSVEPMSEENVALPPIQFEGKNIKVVRTGTTVSVFLDDTEIAKGEASESGANVVLDKKYIHAGWWAAPTIEEKALKHIGSLLKTLK